MFVNKKNWPGDREQEKVGKINQSEINGSVIAKIFVFAGLLIKNNNEKSKTDK